MRFVLRQSYCFSRIITGICRFVFFWYSLKIRILLGHFLPDLVALFSGHHPRAGVKTVVRHLHFDYRISTQVQVPVRVSISAAFSPNQDVGILGSSIQHG